MVIVQKVKTQYIQQTMDIFVPIKIYIYSSQHTHIEGCQLKEHGLPRKATAITEAPHRNYNHNKSAKDGACGKNFT